MELRFIKMVCKCTEHVTFAAMEKKIIRTDNAPAPIGPYNQAVQFGNMLFISTQVMKNLEAILTAAGMTFANVLKTTIFLMDMGQFAQVNEVYGGYFNNDTAPARETVQVSGLPKGVNVEISMIVGK